MKTIKLEKAKGKGWFLTIGDDVAKHRWAVTSVELWDLGKILKDNEEAILMEIDEIEDWCHSCQSPISSCKCGETE